MTATLQFPLALDAEHTAVEEAIYLVRRLGVSGASGYLTRMPDTPRWNAVRVLIADLNPRQTGASNIQRLRHAVESLKQKQEPAATRRDRGHADALSHYVVEAVRLTVTEVAERLPEFTSDDVHEALPDTTAASLALWPSAMGACFRAAALAHEIVDTGRVVRSRRDGARKRKVAVWRKEIALHVV